MEDNNNSLSSTFEALGINLPYNIEAEQAVIGAVIVDQKVLYDVTPILQPDYFYSKSNAEIYRIMLLLNSAGSPVDFVTLLEEVNKANIFPTEAGREGLSLRYNADGSDRFKTLLPMRRLLLINNLQRSLLYAAKDIIDAASDKAETADTLLDLRRAEDLFHKKGQKQTRACPHRTGCYGGDRVLRQDHRAGAREIHGLKTASSISTICFRALNRSDLIILAARPSVGKTRPCVKYSYKRCKVT